MQHDYQEFTDQHLRVFLHNLRDWLNTVGNLAKCPPLTSTDVTNFGALFLDFDKALDKVFIDRGASEIDTETKNLARKAVIQWLEEFFRPFIWGSPNLIATDFQKMGYHKHTEGDTHPVESWLDAPILSAEAAGHFGIRIYPHKSRNKKGKPDNAQICLIQEKITLKDGITLTRPILDAEHEEDQQEAKRINNAIKQNGHQLPPNINDSGWEIIAIVTRVDTGILFHYAEGDKGTERHYRIVWGNHKGYSLWSEVVKSIIF
jgi:hypothetical protein